MARNRHKKPAKEENSDGSSAQIYPFFLNFAAIYNKEKEKMEGHKFVNPTITNWAIILLDAVVAAACLAISNAIAGPDTATGSSTSLYLITIVSCYIISSVWVKPLVSFPGTRFYRIMERTFQKVLLTGLLTTACLFFNEEAVILRMLTGIFLLVFFFALLLTRMAEHAWFKHRFSTAGDEPEAMMEMPRGLYNMGNRIVKRCLDILLSLTFLLTLYPVVYLILFAYSKVKQRGAVYASLRLCDRSGREFTCVRFRALRATNALNALPLFFCVLTGSMSIMGTRPCRPTDILPDDAAVDNDGDTYIGKPGLTGWATLEGFRDAEEERRLDSWYIGNWSFGLDVFIILKGLWNLLFKRNK